MYFYGLVNGKAANAIIKVVCPGPVGPTSIGHPLNGQTAEVRTVLPAGDDQYGYTGSGAHRDRRPPHLLVDRDREPPIVFTSFFAPAKIPMSWVVPCGGTGAMTFVPSPPAPRRASYTVTVTFVNIAV